MSWGCVGVALGSAGLVVLCPALGALAALLVECSAAGFGAYSPGHGVCLLARVLVDHAMMSPPHMTMVTSHVFGLLTYGDLITVAVAVRVGRLVGICRGCRG